MCFGLPYSQDELSKNKTKKISCTGGKNGLLQNGNVQSIMFVLSFKYLFNDLKETIVGACWC